MNEQAIGFLIEFENEASTALKQAVEDFDAAAAALERAVDAAQAAFTFLEEGTGRLARDMTDAVDAAVNKANDLHTAVSGFSNMEIEAPDIDPILGAFEKFGENLETPDMGVQQVIDDLNGGIDPDISGELSRIAEVVNSPLTDDSWLLSVNEAVQDMQTADAVDEWLSALSEGVADAKMADAVSSLDKLNMSLESTKKTLENEFSEAFRGAGQAGVDAAEALADDAVAAYLRMREAAASFVKEGAGQFSSEDGLSVISNFLEKNEEDLKKVQDLLRTASKEDLGSLMQGLSEAIGSAALADEFWKPIASNKTIDKEFFQELRKQFQKETKTPKAWWERLGDTSQKFFWPVFRKQGEKTVDGIGSTLMRVVTSVFSSPIAQLTAALQISRLIEKVFSPFLDEFEAILGQMLMPMMAALIEIIDAVRPTLLEVSRLLEPLFREFSAIGREIMQAIVPAILAFGKVLSGVIPLVVVFMKTVSGPTAAALNFIAELFSAVVYVVIETAMMLYRLGSALKDFLQPVINAVAWLVEFTGISKLLAFVVGAVLSPLLIAVATTAMASLISSVVTAITVTEAFILAKWKSIAAIYREGLAILSNVTGLKSLNFWQMLSAKSSLVWSEINKKGLIPSLLAATKAAWAMTTALLANPITWVVLAVVALGVAIWALWEPIKKVFSAFLFYTKPVWEFLSGFLGVIVEIGSFLLDTLLIPLKIVWKAISFMMSGLWEMFKGLWDGFKQVGSLLAWVGQLFLKLGKSFLVEWILKPIGSLIGMIGRLLSPLKSTFSWIAEVFGAIRDGVSGFIDSFQSLGKFVAILMTGPVGWLVWGLSKISGYLSSGESEESMTAAGDAVAAGAAATVSPALAEDTKPAGVTPQYSRYEAPQMPAAALPMNTAVNYDISSAEAVSPEKFTKPLIAALTRQTDLLISAFANASADATEDLDLRDMRELAGF